jgi:hypothetical protein
MHSGIRLSLGFGLGLAFSACTQTKTVDYSLYRTLDRPVDVALVCASAECTSGVCEARTLPLSACSAATLTQSCQAHEGAPAPAQLIGFVANSERSEIAVFSDCTGKLVDLDVGNPGTSLLPVGHLPISASASDNGCRVVTANAGSCDLSVVDSHALASVALGIEEPLDVDGEPVDPPEMVANLSPLRYDNTSAQWLPLGISPAQIIVAPAEASLGVGEVGDRYQCLPQAAGSAYTVFPGCDLVAEIDLVTGRILQSVQFVRDVAGDVALVATGSSPVCPLLDCPAGGAIAGDTSTLALANLRPRTIELITRHAYPCDVTNSETGAAACRPEEAALPALSILVAGAGEDAIFEIRSDESSKLWSDELSSLALPDAGGISRLRVSPPIPNPSPTCGGPSELFAQFIYAIAGDGSTRVVARDFDEANAMLGVECDTQLDPAGSTDLSCVCEPVASMPAGDRPLRRRLLADGPGIRLPPDVFGTRPRITDWTFTRVSAGLLGSNSGTDVFAPSFADLLVATGTTNQAAIVNAAIGHFGRPSDEARGVGFSPRVSAWTFEGSTPELVGLVDPLKTMAIGLAAHNLVSVDAFTTVAPASSGRPGVAALPLVADEAPARSGPPRAEPHSILSPGLRLIDAVYFDQNATLTSEEILPLDPRLAVGPANGSPNVWTDADKLGSGVNHIYESNPPRVISRDYLSWAGGVSWNLAWEGAIPRTGSARGRMICDKPGFDGSACLPDAPGQSRLVDDSANFCAAGVLAGDKLAIAGCRSDDQCGDGQKCLRRTDSTLEVSGICVSKLAYETNAGELRALCQHFISDPCGEPIREFLITKAFNNELHLQVLDQPEASHLLTSDLDACPGGGRNNHPELVNDVSVCRCDPGFVPCDGRPEDATLPSGDVLDCCQQAQDGSIIEDAVAAEVIDRFVCLQEQPDGGCAIDSDCRESGIASIWDQLSPAAQRFSTSYCMEGRCRRPCMDAEDVAAISAQDRELLGSKLDNLVRDECSVRRLPGPACFQELVRYEVRARNAFVVQSNKDESRYFADQVTSTEDGECVLKPAGSESTLLTSRIPLGRDGEHIGLPPCEAGDQIPGVNSPNPCLEVQPRTSQSPGRFHYFSYGSERSPVKSVRFSNPVMTFNLDLTDIQSLLASIPGTNEAWPAEFATFRRARIPRGYATTFETASNRGYVLDPLRPTLVGSNSNSSSLAYPVRVVKSPAGDRFYVVDAGDQESAIGVRGQVMRLEWNGLSFTPGTHFIGVR